MVTWCYKSYDPWDYLRPGTCDLILMREMSLDVSSSHDAFLRVYQLSPDINDPLHPSLATWSSYSGPWNKTMWRLSLQNLTIATFSPIFTLLSIFILLFWLPSAQWGTFLHEWSLIWIPGSWLLRLWALIKHKQDHFIPATAPDVTCLILKSPKWLLTIILQDKVKHCSRDLEEVHAYHSLSSRIWMKIWIFDCGSRKDGWFG